jgi:hypothetical protein
MSILQWPCRPDDFGEIFDQPDASEGVGLNFYASGLSEALHRPIVIVYESGRRTKRGESSLSLKSSPEWKLVHALTKLQNLSGFCQFFRGTEARGGGDPGNEGFHSTVQGLAGLLLPHRAS